MPIEFQIPLLASSDPLNGALNITENGSRFTIVFTRPIIVPKNAEYCWLTVESGTIVFNTPNIYEGVNNRMDVIFNNSIDPILIFNIEIPTGLYDVDHLNSTIQQQLNNQGADSDGITLIPDTATQRLSIKFREFYQVDLTVENNLAEILGFDERLVPTLPASIENQYEVGDTTARFNTILYYLMHSDLASGYGIRINSNFDNVIIQVPITIGTSTGSQITYEPRNLQKLPAPTLIGRVIREASFWVTDDKNNPIDTLNEVWSLRMNIHYYMKEK